MKVVGLCGGTGAGKGLVSAIFAEFGVVSIDTDAVYHNMISTDSKCAKELILTFGDTIKAQNGIDRRALRDIVFKSHDQLNLLNKITHKHILADVKAKIQTLKEKGDCIGVLIDAPLLFESKFNDECDVTVCVIADNDIRLERIIKRDGLTEAQAETRIRSQISNEQLMQMCDYCIENNSDINSLREKIFLLKTAIFDN